MPTTERRKDNRGRNLNTGESQTKEGRYVYKYMDLSGHPKFLYSWKLVPTDKIPKGKRNDISLREKEKKVQKDLADGIDTAGGKMKVCQLYQKQIRQKGNVRLGTKKQRAYFAEHLANDPLGRKSIDTVKVSDGKEWAVRQKEKGVAYNTINNQKRSLKASFYTAIDDDCIRKNPFNFILTDVIPNDTVRKEALTAEQEAKFLEFARTDKVYKKYYDDIVVLLETGLRISEFCGLTIHLDMKNKVIDVNHQLLRDTEIGYYIEYPKTESGFRQIPMSNKAYEAIRRIIRRRRKEKGTPLVIDGYKDFLFLKKDGLPKVATNYEGMFRGLVKKYNKYHDEPLPNITPHTLRHTFCTKMANKGMNPKALQYIMGHANITMTLNYYAHADFASAKAEMDRLSALVV